MRTWQSQGQVEASGFFFDYDFSISMAISVLDAYFTNILELVPIHLPPLFLAAATRAEVPDPGKKY